MLSRRSSWLFAVLLLICAGAVHAQTEVAALIEGWQARATSFFAMKQVDGSIPSDKKSELLSLLQAENKVYNHLLDDLDPNKSPSGVLGEEYVEYYHELFDECLKAGESGSTEMYAVLAEGAFDPSTEAFSRVLKQPRLILDALLLQATSPSNITRLKVEELLRAIPEEVRSGLPPDTEAKVDGALKKFASDSDPYIAERAKLAPSRSSSGGVPWIPALLIALALAVIVFVVLRRRQRV